MNYSNAIEILYNQAPMFQNIGKRAYKTGLETTYELDEIFQHPHRKFRTIHVAGTNGKGSCSHLTAAVLQSAGYKVGLYTSPHLKDFRERIRINGEMISEEAVCEFVELAQPIIAVVISKNEGWSSAMMGWANSTNSHTASSLIISPLMRMRSRKSLRWGDV